jgi:3-oxoacyl-[acyl-carrier-protein] synthase-3
LATSDNFLARGQAKTQLVIGAETFSRIVDWTDRSTCVLFGDGAGAILMRAMNQADAKGRGVISTYIRSDGRQHDLLYVDGGPSQTQSVGHLRMQGNQVFRHAVEHIADAMSEAARRGGVPLDDVDWFVPHQANQRILDGVARRLNVPPHKVISTVAEHGNTSAASVPLALWKGMSDGRIKQGHLVLMEALGGGLTWGAVLARL